MLFQLIILRQPVEAAMLLVGGLTAVIVGLAFLWKVECWADALGTLIGDKLSRKASMPVMLAIIAILGVGVTFAEPAIGALQALVHRRCHPCAISL